MATHHAVLPQYGNAAFQHGFQAGISWFATGDWPNIPPTVEQIVDFIKQNMLELAAEGWLDDERLTDNAGFLVGWVVAQFVK